MANQIGQRKTRVVIAFVLGAAPAASLAQSQSFASQPPAEAAPSGYTAPMGLTGYEIRNLEGKVAAQAVVRVDYEAPSKKTFNKTSEKGSGIVRHLVFDRLMQSEGETSSGREHHDSAITTANYEFKR